MRSTATCGPTRKLWQPKRSPTRRRSAWIQPGGPTRKQLQPEHSVLALAVDAAAGVRTPWRKHKEPLKKPVCCVCPYKCSVCAAPLYSSQKAWHREAQPVKLNPEQWQLLLWSAASLAHVLLHSTSRSGKQTNTATAASPLARLAAALSTQPAGVPVGPGNGWRVISSILCTLTCYLCGWVRICYAKAWQPLGQGAVLCGTLLACFEGRLTSLQEF